MSDAYDPYERGSGGQPGKPAVSWKKADVGDKFTGVVVPPDPNLPEKGYASSQEWDGDPREPLFWAPRGYSTDKGLWKGPIPESKWVAYVGRPATPENGARPVVRPDVTFVTDYRGFEFCSGQAKQRIQEAGETDDGIRRIIVSGQSLREAHEAALDAAGADRPQPGQRWTVTLAKQTPNDKGGHTNTFTVTIEAPTDETRRVVADYVAKRKAELAEATTPDAYAGAGVGGGSQSEEPPF